MGTYTEFYGYLEANREFTQEEINIIHDFSRERHDGPEYPGIWCQWVIDNGVLEWDGIEKFYNYTEWLEYLIKHFFNEWNIVLNGSIIYQVDYITDRGKIEVIDNKINVIKLE